MSVSETASVPHASSETNNECLGYVLNKRWNFAVIVPTFGRQIWSKVRRAFDFEDKEAATQSQLKKLKTESKASNSFTFKENKVQYELNISLRDLVDGDIKNISKGNLSAAISELESVKTLTPFAVHYEKRRNHLRETATNSAKPCTFISAKIRTFAHKPDSITIFAF